MSEVTTASAVKPFIGSDRRSEILSRLAARRRGRARNKSGGNRRTLQTVCNQADGKRHNQGSAQGHQGKG
jgi:hypothetical protein